MGVQDVDVGITPLALQYLELNSTREEMWKHGYTIWAHQCECVVLDQPAMTQ